MVFITKIAVFLLSLSLLASCQLGYIAQSAIDQAKLMRARVPIQYALDHYDLTDEQRQKLELTKKVRTFMAEELGLDTGSNYVRYVHLDRDYVTYAVNASAKNELKTYKWHFPVIGSVPYKGFFDKNRALAEAEELKAQGLDTYVRGVSAYSTLGWFEDPLLSSMLRAKEHRFINTLIHETVHANLYIKGHSKFNEKVATFMGLLGAEAYYSKIGKLAELQDVVEKENHDELMFSKFITREMKSLRDWYSKNQDEEDLLEKRVLKFKALQEKFQKEVLPKLQTDGYGWFTKRTLNNAFLLLLELYNSDFDQLERLAQKHNRDFKKVLAALKKLEDSDTPEADLKKLTQL